MPLIKDESMAAVAVDASSLVVAVLASVDEPLVLELDLLCELMIALNKSTALCPPLVVPEPSIDIRLESEDMLTASLVM